MNIKSSNTWCVPMDMPSSRVLIASGDILSRGSYILWVSSDEPRGVWRSIGMEKLQEDISLEGSRTDARASKIIACSPVCTQTLFPPALYLPTCSFSHPLDHLTKLQEVLQ